jgi:hypothetical protein
MGWPVTVKEEDRPVVAQTAIQRYLDGERIEDIAPTYGLSAKRLYAYLTEHAEAEWKSAQVGASLERLEEAKTEMNAATTMQDVARAREKARLAQWDLERVCRRIYGSDAPATLGQGTVTISINLNAAALPVDNAERLDDPAGQQLP